MNFEIRLILFVDEHKLPFAVATIFKDSNIAANNKYPRPKANANIFFFFFGDQHSCVCLIQCTILEDGKYVIRIRKER